MGIKIKLDANCRKADLYQIGTQAHECQVNPGLVEIDADDLAREAQSGERGCTAAEERVEDGVAFV